MVNLKRKKKKPSSPKPKYEGFTFWWKPKESNEEERLIQWPPPEILEKRMKLFRRTRRKNAILKIAILIFLAWITLSGLTTFLKRLQ